MMKGKSAVFFVSLLVLAMFMAVSAASAGAPIPRRIRRKKIFAYSFH